MNWNGINRNVLKVMVLNCLEIDKFCCLLFIVIIIGSVLSLVDGVEFWW